MLRSKEEKVTKSDPAEVVELRTPGDFPEAATLVKKETFGWRSSCTCLGRLAPTPRSARLDHYRLSDRLRGRRALWRARLNKLQDEMRSYIDRANTVVKIGSASLDEDLLRIDSTIAALFKDRHDPRVQGHALAITASSAAKST